MRLLVFFCACSCTRAFPLPPSPSYTGDRRSSRLVAAESPSIHVSAADVRSEKRRSQVREATKVRLNGTNISSFAGFLDVNPAFNSSLFFWFIPALEVNQMDAPLVLWLQGLWRETPRLRAK